MSTPRLLDAVRSRTAELAEYEPGHGPAVPNGAKLSSNEAPWGPSWRVTEALKATVAELHRYPSTRRLQQVIADSEGFPEDFVITTNGSDELCQLIATVFIAPDSAVVLSEPCYRIDEIVSCLGAAQLRRVPLQDGHHDLPRMAQAARGATVLWLPSPHNPTGCATEPEGLKWLLAEVDDDCLVVLDEAYRHFADPINQPDVRELIESHPNLVVQRTLSKVHALAGLRIGYGIADPEVIKMLLLARPPFSNNVCAIAAAEAALGDPAWSDYLASRVRDERERFERFLERIGCHFWPSQANFVTVLFADEADRVEAALGAEGVSVRNGRDLGAPGWLRISIGTPPHMELVRRILRRTV